MWDFVRTLFGAVTGNELLLVGLFFACVLLFSGAPRIGEAIGGWFERNR